MTYAITFKIVKVMSVKAVHCCEMTTGIMDSVNIKVQLYNISLEAINFIIKQEKVSKQILKHNFSA